MKPMTMNGGGLRAGAWRLLAVVLATSPWLAACNTDNLLKVSAPDNLPADDYIVPQQAGLLVNGAIADFECAFAAGVLVEGIISDELADAQSSSANWDYDRRSSNQYPGGTYGTGGCNSSQSPGIYLPLSTARWDADNVLTNLQKWSPADVGAARDSLIAASALYAGFGYAMIAMSMCNAAFDLGPSQTQAQMFALAEQRFSSAIQVASQRSFTNLLNAAYVGRARVRLFQGNLSGADADAKLVPAGFVYNATYSSSTSRRYNRVYTAIDYSPYYTVAAPFRNVTTEGVVDPRTPVKYGVTLRGQDGQIIWMQQKYTAYGTPIPLAKYDEAQLIMAEAEGGQNAITIINALRDRWSLPHYSGATDAASIKQLIISERSKSLFLEGQRNYDIARFKIPFTPPEGAAFEKGGNYGNTTCLPLPDIERFNNPNIS